MAIGTARMASLCLPNSELHLGIDWSASPALARALSDPARPPALLYPGDGAVDVVAHPPAGPITLVVVDGTWALTRKVVRKNPVLAALPRYAFKPPNPSEYRIRKEPDAEYVSTLEALVHVLGALEGDAERFRAMLVPFRAMIDAQIACEATLQGGRVRYARGRRPRRPGVSSLLRERPDDVVCVAAEANAWPSQAKRGRGELVQWLAHRPATGETFEIVLAPRDVLAPNTAAQTGLSEELLRDGDTVEALREGWAGFARETDLLCVWGDFATSLFETLGVALPTGRIDLRKVARSEAKGKVGNVGECAKRLGLATESMASMGHGRAGMRLAQLVALARHYGQER